MGTTIRCKLRCLERTETWNGSARVLLRPVMNKHGDNYEENTKFWRWTPGGEMRVAEKAACLQFKPGTFYYVDFVPDGAWSLSRTSLYGDGGEVELTCYDHGYNEAKFQLSSADTVALFGPPGSKFQVVFTEADASPDDPE